MKGLPEGAQALATGLVDGVLGADSKAASKWLASNVKPDTELPPSFKDQAHAC
jgi:hypothetical protein